MRCAPLILATCLACVAIVQADEATSAISRDYWLTTKEGPWLIYVASYHGDDAATMAHDLVKELREQYKLQAFVFSRSEKERRERDEQLKRLREQYGSETVKKVRIVDEYAVMVGNYKTMDQAAAAAKDVRKLEPPKSGAVPLFAVGSFSKRNNKADGESLQRAKANPFAQSFPARNPLLPRDASVQKDPTAADALWMHLNLQEKHGLLKNPKMWTIAVKIYGGQAAAVATKGGILDKLKPWGSATEDKGGTYDDKQLQANAAQARKLVETLRSSAYDLEAYVLHSHDSTFVTVGGYADPKDPEVLRMQRKLSGMVVGTERLMDQPGPMLVPKPRGPSLANPN